jgi:tetratricopeptide (TPR) repeat protein
MKILGMKVLAALAVGVLGLAVLAQPGRLVAQSATIHGHVQNAAGQPISDGTVRLTTDRNPNSNNRKYEYSFPVDAHGDYKGTVDKPGSYLAVAFQQEVTLDFQPVVVAASEDKTVDFDMTRKEYIDKMSPAEREQLEELKKKNAEAMAANSKIQNLNNFLTTARTDIKAGNFDPAVKAMTDATAAKPDEPILWEVLGEAQLDQANAAAKAATDAKATDASVPDKYAAAEVSYQKALDLNAKAAKPDLKLIAVANNQLGQAYGRTGKIPEAAAAYEAAAKADPAGAGMYYFNEAATLFNVSVKTGKVDGLAEAADKAIAADPTKAEAYYIKTQALAPLITQTADGKGFVSPPGLIDACNKYLELAPQGAHSQDIKDLMAGLGEKIQTTYKAPAKK